MGFLYDLPLWVVGVVLVVLLCSLAVLGLQVARRRIVPRFHIADDDGHFISTMVHSFMVFYALTVAMIAISVWETYDAAAKVASAEATALGTLYRDVSAYPSPAQAQLQGALREYTEHVITVAWPEQHQGRVPLGGIDRIDQVLKLLTGFEPTTEGEKILHAETLRAFNQLSDARRMRLDAVQTALPGLLWTVIFLGAALGVAGSYFFRVKDARLHRLLVTLLTTFIAMVIFVVFAFDRPFRGDMGIKAEPYQLVYDHLLRR
jgi:hypothetical protein